MEQLRRTIEKQGRTIESLEKIIETQAEIMKSQAEIIETQAEIMKSQGKTIQKKEEQETLDEKTKKDLMEIVTHKYWEFSVSEIIEHMKEKGYECVGKIIEKALWQNIFSVSTIDEEGSVWLELGFEGEYHWNEYNRGKEGYIEKDKDEIEKIQWKCSMCNYQFEGNATPPEKCPGCGQTCSFIDATCYIPECKGPEGRDRRI